MIPKLYTTERDGPGRLSTMARPRGGDWLAEELAGLKRIRVDAVVSALMHDELLELDLVEEPEIARQTGLDFVSVPIPDRGTPKNENIMEALTEMQGLLTAGLHMVVHCRMGIGRSSMLAAAVMVLEGADREDTWHRIATARGLPVPDTDEQRAWVRTITESRWPAPVFDASNSTFKP